MGRIAFIIILLYYYDVEAVLTPAGSSFSDWPCSGRSSSSPDHHGAKREYRGVLAWSPLGPRVSDALSVLDGYHLDLFKSNFNVASRPQRP